MEQQNDDEKNEAKHESCSQPSSSLVLNNHPSSKSLDDNQHESVNPIFNHFQQVNQHTRFQQSTNCQQFNNSFIND